MLKYERKDLINADLSRILMESSDRNIFLKNIREHIQTGDVELLFHTQDSGVRQFLVSASLTANNLVICSAIDITERKLAEQVIAKAREDLEQRVKERTEELLRANEVLKSEIYERKRFETAIQLANRKLNTLSSITRHDILNQITAIVMYLSLAEESSSDPGVIEQLHKIEEITQLIQKQIRFTRDYQTIGESTPHWQNIGVTVDNAMAGLDLGTIKVEKNCGTLELFADYLLEKVFYNIMDNSVRHGEKVTTLRYSYRENGNGITLVIEDDGIGIPEGVKEKIFKREYYRNTGYGLFLAEEILGITGITISETGVPGKGARFEIHAPKGTYRYGEPDAKV
jgi:signal transduction histidine kinase